MIFVNSSMFTGDIHIPNLEEKCIQDVEIYKLISKWERECLEFVLGKCLFDQLMAEIELKTSGTVKHYGLKESADEKWKWLVEGRTYEKTDESISFFDDLSVCGCGCSSGKCKFHTWDGFVTKTPSIIKNELVEFQESFLAYYIYYMWSFHNETRTTGIGEQKPESKNSVTTFNKTKRVDAFNYFFAKVKMCSRGGRVSLYGFIKEHSELYPDFQGADFKPLNYWDV